MSRHRLPTLFVSHGGGPWPWIEEMSRLFAVSAAGFASLPARLPTAPKAILAISGHWEEERFTVGTSAHPPTLYDYSGFPQHTYHIRYPAPGSPPLAARVRELLKAAGIECREDPERGVDHGVFVPLHLMYPQAEIPVVMLSLRSGYDPSEHLHMGQALEPLRDEGVLILGSGLTYHDLRRFGPQGGEASERFEAWLTDAVTQGDAKRRATLLEHWEEAPFARAAHPREDHLLPLMVAAGAAGESAGERLFVDQVWGITMASYLFGGDGRHEGPPR